MLSTPRNMECEVNEYLSQYQYGAEMNSTFTVSSYSTCNKEYLIKTFLSLYLLT